MTPDPEAAKRFYGTLFGWTLGGHGHGPGNLPVVKAGGAAFGGIMKRPRNTRPTHRPLGDLRDRQDVDATARTAEALGAKSWSHPRTSPRSDAFMLQDPQGAVIAAITYVKEG